MMKYICFSKVNTCNSRAIVFPDTCNVNDLSSVIVSMFDSEIISTGDVFIEKEDGENNLKFIIETENHELAADLTEKAFSYDFKIDNNNKYVSFKDLADKIVGIVLFPELFQHVEIDRLMNRAGGYLSETAGFVNLEGIICFGTSLSLGLGSNPETDTPLLRKQLER